MKQVLTLFAFIYLTMIAFPTKKRAQTQSITLRCENFKNGECLSEWKTLTGGKNEQKLQKEFQQLSKEGHRKPAGNGPRSRLGITKL